jgi:DNA-binding NtrC family response regulator
MDAQLKSTSHTMGTRKSAPTDTRGFQDGAVGAPVEGRRAVAVFSADESIMKLVADLMIDSWVVENCTDPHEARAFLVKPGVRMVVIDDEAIEESTRAWLLGQVHMRASQALIAYIAAIHSPEAERRARAYSVQYYTSKPVDRERMLRVLHSFARATH